MNSYFIHTAPEHIRERYARENNAGNGFGVGAEDQTIEAAIQSAGWLLEDSYADSLAVASDSKGNRYIVGADGSRRNAWAVSAE